MIDLARPVVPQKPPRRAWYASSVVAGSLLLHAAIVAPLVWSHRAEAAREPEATPVEVVQMPPEPEKPAAKPTARVEPKAAEKPTARPPAPRQAQARPPKPPPRPRSPEPREKPQEKSTAERMQQLIGPMPAYAMPAVASSDDPLDDTASYRQLVLSRVAAQKREGRHDGIPGHVVVSFAIGDGGEVLHSEIREKSDDPKLDAEALAMVARGAPYPAPPPGAPRAFSFGLRFQVL